MSGQSSITVLTGATGSGKSRALIERVQQVRLSGREVRTFVCSAYPWPRENTAYWQRRVLVCRVPGLTTALDHFVSAEDLRRISESLPAGTMLAIEEAFAFGQQLVPVLDQAAHKGVDVIVAHPSADQLAMLEHPYEEEHHSMICDRCDTREGAEPIIPWDGAWTQTVCHECFAEARDEARTTIVDALRKGNPEPGEDELYQPIPLPEVETWPLARNDTLPRARVVAGVLTDLGLLERGRVAGRLSYLDIGCCTGSFCNYFAHRGFSSKGVDAVEDYIGVARLMDSFYRRPVRQGREFVLYEQASAHDYLTTTADELVDFSSAFAVFQWVMVQHSYEYGAECIGMLAAKTRHLMVLEMPYSSEEHYSDKLSETVNRDSVMDMIRPHFRTVKVIDAGTHGIKRDLFFGVKEPLATPPRNGM